MYGERWGVSGGHVVCAQCHYEIGHARKSTQENRHTREVNYGDTKGKNQCGFYALVGMCSHNDARLATQLMIGSRRE